MFRFIGGRPLEVYDATSGFRTCTLGKSSSKLVEFLVQIFIGSRVGHIERVELSKFEVHFRGNFR